MRDDISRLLPLLVDEVLASHDGPLQELSALGMLNAHVEQWIVEAAERVRAAHPDGPTPGQVVGLTRQAVAQKGIQIGEGNPYDADRYGRSPLTDLDDMPPPTTP